MNTPPPGTGTFGAPTGPPPPPPPPRSSWRFVRRERGRMIAGVATGMADAFHIDVVVMRVIWVVLAVASFGVGVAAYAICWLAFPSEEHPAPLTELRDHNARLNTGLIVGLALLGLGLVIVFGEAVPPFRHGGDVAWATVLIGAGLAVLLLRHSDDNDHEPPARPFAPRDEPSDNPSADTGSHADTADASDLSDTHTTPTSSWVPPAPPFAPTPPIPPSAWTQSVPWPNAPQRHERRHHPRSFLTPLTISVLLIGGGVVWLLDNNDTAHFTLAGILAGGLCIVGLALVVSTWLGRARGLVPLGILLLLVTVPAAAIDVPITGGTGKRTYYPTTRADLRSKYELGIGRLEIDLLDAPLVGRTTRLRAQLGIGEMVVEVPSTVRVVAHAHAGAGSINLFGSNEDGGWSAEQTRSTPGTGSGVLDLDLRVGAGHVQVRRFDPNGVQTIFPGSN